jgi:putative Mn2+ efflux pump MntP
MSFGSIVMLAIGLAMDATAVAAAHGAATPRVRPRHVLSVALFFGGFQASMAALGWLAGRRVGPLVQAWDHWLAFALLAVIGGKMFWEGFTFESSRPGKSDGADLFGVRIMLALSVATSIDALAVGITLPMLNAPFALTISTIGLVTALLSALGLFAGRRFGALVGGRLDVAGGMVLIGLGTKILVDHLQHA